MARVVVQRRSPGPVTGPVEISPKSPDHRSDMWPKVIGLKSESVIGSIPES
jgi:hypothetical protein